MSSVDIFEQRVADKGPLGKHGKRAYGYFMYPRLEGEIGPHMHFRGKPVLNWSLNNYIGLANHPEVRETDAEAAARFGMALPMGARMMSGNSIYHEQLEAELSDFIQKPATLLLNYGYQGIMSAIDALLRRHDVAVYDAEAHACIIDGLRLFPGKRFMYKHNDLESLEKQLARAEELAAQQGGGVMVITEGIFGMNGNQGRLAEIIALKEKYAFRLLVDDAHGFGTMGKTGAGTGEEQECMEGIDLYFSTFAKSMASIGAFISGDEEIIDFLRYNMRSQIYAKSLPMPIVIGALKRLELLRSRPELRENLWTIVHALQGGLKARGFDIGTTNTPVTPVIMQGDENHATKLVLDLRENYSIFCSIVVYPVVPRGLVILRIIPTAVHTLEDVERTIKAFEEVKEKLETGVYAAQDSPLEVEMISI
jgi:glycine C-acetyltransferase